MVNIKLIISMDWEGCDLLDRNLDSIKEFKKKWNCPITHYLNAGYYTNPNTMMDQVTDKIHMTMQSDDEAGLHLHAPRHFVESAGVGLKNGPTFSKHGDYNSGQEFGQEVMLHGYSKPELDRLISHSKTILEDKGLGPLKSFRAGGWMCDEKLIDSLADNEFEIESSATVAELLEGSSWENDNLQRYISLMWDDITMDSSPYYLTTNNRKLLEIPNNLGAIDYWQPSWIEILAQKCIENAQNKTNYVAVINSHQETFSDNVDKLTSFIESIKLCPYANVQFTNNQEVLNKLKESA
ncbi:MAG: hypothetical protein KC478_11610 [Bacteriovoracaceae bacterium]|nr:hypothetical protein [Bacteriovoracaceae bacterium]